MGAEVIDIKWAVESLSSRSASVRLAEQYYRGDHRLVFATDRFRNAFGSLFTAFADNL